MDANLFDLDFLVSELYSFLYDKTSSVKPNLEILDLKNITTEDYKYSNITEKEQKFFINKNFNQNFKFLYRNLNKYFYKFTSSNKISVNVSFEYYYTNNTENMFSSENMNSLMTFVLSDLVIKKQTKGILLHLLNIDLDSELLIPLFKKQNETIDLLDKKNKKVKCCVSEHFFKQKKFDLEIDNLNIKQIYSIIFQVLTTLATIQQSYPTFKHNNLDMESIFLYFKKPSTMFFEHNKKIKEINDEGVEAKISNFDYSEIKGYIENDDTKNFNNKHFLSDALFFLGNIKKNVTNNDIKDYVSKIILKMQSDKNISIVNIIMSELISIEDFINKKNNNLSGGGKNKKSKIISMKRYLTNDITTSMKHNTSSKNNGYGKNDVSDDSDSDIISFGKNTFDEKYSGNSNSNYNIESSNGFVKMFDPNIPKSSGFSEIDMVNTNNYNNIHQDNVTNYNPYNNTINQNMNLHSPLMNNFGNNAHQFNQQPMYQNTPLQNVEPYNYMLEGGGKKN